MANKLINSRENKTLSSPSNSALSNYFDDLTSSTESQLEKKIITRPSPSNIVDEKIYQAECLLQKANNISMLLNDHDDHDLATLQKKPKRTNKQDAVSHDSLHNEAFVLIKENSVVKDKEKPLNAETIDRDQIRDASISLHDALPEQFQVLLCKIANLTIAVPLLELGGIHQLDKISTIAGKPDWFKGILIKGDVKYQCIDATHWIMPEKFSAGSLEKIDYKFAIQLGKTPFVLCCDSVSTTIELTKDEIKWRIDDKKRPWLAGILKDKMCALIDGARMVQVVLAKV